MLEKCAVGPRTGTDICDRGHRCDRHLHAVVFDRNVAGIQQPEQRRVDQYRGLLHRAVYPGVYYSSEHVPELLEVLQMYVARRVALCAFFI